MNELKIEKGGELIHRHYGPVKVLEVGDGNTLPYVQIIASGLKQRVTKDQLKSKDQPKAKDEPTKPAGS